jgi:hypothetical protein
MPLQVLETKELHPIQLELQQALNDAISECINKVMVRVNQMPTETPEQVEAYQHTAHHVLRTAHQGLSFHQGMIEHIIKSNYEEQDLPEVNGFLAADREANRLNGIRTGARIQAEQKEGEGQPQQSPTGEGASNGNGRSDTPL